MGVEWSGSVIEYRFKPLGPWPRKETPTHQRRIHPFKGGKTGWVDGAWQGQKSTPLSTTYAELEKELKYLNADGFVVFEIGLKEHQIRQDGRPRADAGQPSFPGIILSFTSKTHGALRFVCDDCRHWEDNLRAIVLTMERLRLADLYGVTKSGEQYRGWKALSGAIVTPAPMTLEEAATFVNGQAGRTLNSANLLKHPDIFRTAYRVAVTKLHPDKNGGVTPPEWHRLQQAAEILNRHHGIA